MKLSVKTVYYDLVSQDISFIVNILLSVRSTWTTIPSKKDVADSLFYCYIVCHAMKRDYYYYY